MVSLIMVHKINGGLPKINKTGQIISICSSALDRLLIKSVIGNNKCSLSI